MTYPESLASQWPGDECSSESPLLCSTLIKAKKKKKESALALLAVCACSRSTTQRILLPGITHVC